MKERNSGYFSGSLDSLKTHWSNAQRAKKFSSGGTRFKAILYLINRIEVDVHKGLWLDTAIGAGFVQSQLSDSVNPVALLGVDFSRTMLDEIKNKEILPILSSVFSLPFRSNSISVVTNIFCFSDYLKPTQGFYEMVRVANSPGIIIYLDYEENDEYWKKRLELHGKEGKSGETIIGNIHLRNLKSVKEFFPNDVRLVHQANIRYKVESKNLQLQFDLPPKITRSFLYLEYYKPRLID